MGSSVAALERQMPAAPGPLAEPVYCRCRSGTTKIAVVDGAWIYVTKSGRRTVAHLPAFIQCEQCGRWTPVLDDKTPVG